MWRNAHIDELTELPGRQALKRHLSVLSHDFAIAILDLDHFKLINDQYGHHTGDQVLRFVASFLRTIGEGKAYRYGGEEFVIIYDGETAGNCAPKLDDLRKSIERREFWIRGKDRPRKKPEPASKTGDNSRSQRIVVTVSIGVADDGKSGAPSGEVLGKADKALYKAKADGRNRVRVAR
ncbi:MAG: GGDEF domain-containing protein [Deltaproteobacteria bacterium]|nr:GGDEF domain-containing protein [Deltaproteobacteria bacterium]